MNKSRSGCREKRSGLASGGSQMMSRVRQKREELERRDSRHQIQSSRSDF